MNFAKVVLQIGKVQELIERLSLELHRVGINLFIRMRLCGRPPLKAKAGKLYVAQAMCGHARRPRNVETTRVTPSKQASRPAGNNNY
jgi:hypothetical protein